MQPDDNQAQTWLIEQYVLGELPPGVAAKLEERMRADPVLEQRVLTQWLVVDYLQHEQQTTRFYQQSQSITTSASGRKQHTPQGIQYLTWLVGVAALVLLCLSVWVYLQMRPAQPQIGSVPVTGGDDHYGMVDTDDSTVVLRYDRNPRFWIFRDQYAWASDTLKIYSSSLSRESLENWQLERTEKRGVFVLKTKQQQYKLTNTHTELTDLVADENL
ncbi:hypothetical protein [Spirosoma montaniterrae]|uniref:Uncharacterized protein n=1 Tax=Spirosoma montaniterrae TaxID=1178516 RepID=A0A1P9WT55_9BACT|nr:hypothetical protein [Spirosoma montaniterrae]AQG78547.1 hypothetical protein AWR27_03840 [Spirosoma montaniterrae]